MQYNPEEFIEILNIFKVESEEIIQELNDDFLALEKMPDDKTPLKKLFQLAHSLKGGARMIGFNSVQNLAHKLEDILSYWKKPDVKIDVNSFQIIYDLCDFLNELIVKSVEDKADYSDSRVNVFIEKLGDIIISDKMVPVQEKKESQESVISKKSTDINAILLELIFVLEIDCDKDNLNEIVQVVSDNLSLLYEIFQNTDLTNIKENINNLIKYISNNNDTDFIRQEVEKLRNDIYSLYKDLNISFSNNKTENTKPVENTVSKSEKNDKNSDLSEKFDLILKNLPKIKFDKQFINEINKSLESIIKNPINKKTELIISKTLNILKLFQSKNIVIDNDCYMVILQCIYLAKRMSLNEKEENLNNLNFLIQRLSVVEDMFNITDIEISKIKDKQDTNVVSLEEINNIKKNTNSYEMQEIKTLRVDTVKVDSLISQTGELLVNGIRTREHLEELSVINSKLINWNSESKKILNYIKYLEKKGFFNANTDESLLGFYKKTQSFFCDNADIISDIQNDFGRLYNIISEDDNKLHQTVMEIETIAKGIRVLPLATIFHSFSRMIRDIAIENNKKIDFIISGSDTTVDKKLIEEIKMPLIHILRNAVSHGIEVPSERVKNGKRETGVIRLTAKNAENNVFISIEDDGYGINLEKVKQTALKKGILTEEELLNIPNEQLMKLLFLPGFSTEESITEISGRGIGLDVVKTKINNLNGDIYIDSVLNKGCCVTIKLPLSMSTIKTFIIVVNSQKYAIPISSIKFVKKIKEDEIFDRNGKNCIIFESRSIPIYSISEILGEKSDNSMREKELTVIIIENQERQAAFVVDKLLGSQEVFHKKLVPPIMKIRNISGFTTLPTGEICLIINPYELIRNTIMNNYIQSYDIKRIETYKENKKVLVLNNEYILKDLSEEIENTIGVNNLDIIYDYIKADNIKALVCGFDKNNSDIKQLIKYIKDDELFSKIKVIIISDMSEFEINNILDGTKADLYLRLSNYNKEVFINTVKNIL